MLKRKRSGSRSKPYRGQLPTVVRWSLGVILGLAVLVAVAYLYGNPASKDQDFFTSLHETFRHPAVATVASLAAAVWVALCVRQLVFEFHAWWPGRILVQEFVAGPNAEDAEVIRLTEAFRDRLARAHLQSPAAVPAPAPQGDFLDVLTSGAMDTNPMSMIIGFVRAARPTHAYEIKGAVCRRPGDSKPCGVTMHLERLPGKAGPGVTLWDADWDGAVARAADHATASIMPRTRRCQPPWSAWRGFRLPGALLHLYERGVELEIERRFDEALDLYYKAAEKDPMNLALRLQIGYVQEKLALFIDALDTYEAILAVASPGREGHGPVSLGAEAERGHRHHARDLALTKRARGDRLRRFYRGRERRNRDRVLLAARYRRAILLGGSEVPRQWCKQPRRPPTRRDLERDAIRARLAPSMRQTFEAALKSEHVEWATRPVYGRAGGRARKPQRTGRLRKPLATRLRDRVGGGQREVTRFGRTQLGTVLEGCGPRDELEELCVLASIHELVILRRQVPWLRPMKDVPLTRAVVDLSGLCLTHRLRRVHRSASTGTQAEADPEAVRLSIRKIEGLRGFRGWQEHYNAACAYALPLLDPDRVPNDEDERRLMGAAVTRLERAIECADSGFVARRRDWLLSDDPDLDALRTTDAFKHFEAIYFPSALTTRRRPPGLHKWELSRYTLDLLSGTGTEFARCWRARKVGLGAETEVRALTDWCDVEMEAWSRVLDVTRNHQHWRTRVKLLELSRALARRADFSGPEVRFPRFAELETPVADQIEAWVERNDDRMETLADAIEKGQRKARRTPLLEDLALRRVQLGQIDGSGTTLSRPGLADLCEAHATVWQAFGKCVTECDEDPKQLLEAIEGLIERWEGIKSTFLNVGAGTDGRGAAGLATSVAPPEPAAAERPVPYFAEPRPRALRRWAERHMLGRDAPRASLAGSPERVRPPGDG